jgi:hypothetical protein
MVFAMVTRITTTVQKIVTLLVSVMMVMYLTVLMMIAVQSHGLVMALRTVKIRPLAVT